jgi:predicted phage-related endonuclease
MGSKPIGISASRGAAVLGLSQFQTPVGVWTQIMEDRQPGFCLAHGIEPPESVANAAIRWGLGFESAVIALAEISRGMEIHSREAFCELCHTATSNAAVGNDVPITAHLDGIYEDGRIHEGKTSSAFSFRESWGEPGTDRVPRAYAVQLQHQMLASGADSAVLSVLVFPERPDVWEASGLRVDPETGIISRGPAVPFDEEPNPDDSIEPVTVLDSTIGWARVLRDMGYFHQYRVGENVELQAMMLERYRDFWTRYVIGETPPPAETYADILRLVPEPHGTVVANEQQGRWAGEYAQINAEMATAKKQQDKLKALLLGAVDRGAEHPIDSDSVEAIVLRDRTGKKIASYSKGKDGRKTFRCGG